MDSFIGWIKLSFNIFNVTPHFEHQTCLLLLLPVKDASLIKFLNGPSNMLNVFFLNSQTWNIRKRGYDILIQCCSRFLEHSVASNLSIEESETWNRSQDHRRIVILLIWIILTPFITENSLKHFRKENFFYANRRKEFPIMFVLKVQKKTFSTKRRTVKGKKVSDSGSKRYSNLALKYLFLNPNMIEVFSFHPTASLNFILKIQNSVSCSKYCCFRR